MKTKLVPIKNAPSSSHWDLAGVRGDLLFWRSRNKKLFAQDKVTKQWYKVVSGKE